MKIRSSLNALILMASVGAFVIGIENKPAVAGCNPFGCSQSSVAECNPFGCPKAPMGEKCTPFGCPPSPQPPQQQQPIQQQSTQQPPVPAGYPPYPYPPYPYPYPNQNVGGNPQAIQQCMKGLMYERQLVCNRQSGCSRIQREGFGGWEFGMVRTQISEAAAVQACQNSR